jgi:hypothetical protein
MGNTCLCNGGQISIVLRDRDRPSNHETFSHPVRKVFAHRANLIQILRGRCRCPSHRRHVPNSQPDEGCAGEKETTRRSHRACQQKERASRKRKREGGAVRTHLISVIVVIYLLRLQSGANKQSSISFVVIDQQPDATAPAHPVGRLAFSPTPIPISHPSTPGGRSGHPPC